MNSRLDIILWGVTAEEAAHISQEIISAGSNLQKALNRFDPKSETNIVNHRAKFQETPISPKLTRAILDGINYYQLTKGVFNVFAGNAFDAAKNGRNTEDISSLEDPRECVMINEQQQTVRFTTNYVSLDFGGIGKGMVLDEAAGILSSYPTIHAFISFGGSSVLTRGHHPHGEFWPFSFRESEITETWHLTDDALSISQTLAGKGENPHILNIIGENPTKKNQMACVQSHSATDAEVLSTALLAAPPNTHEQIVAAFHIKKHRIYNLIA